MDHSTTQPTQPCQPNMQYGRGERTAFFLLSGLLFTLLSIAACLKPDPAGLGTHTQLGLPGCTMVSFLGMRCPGCGMTTSWAHMMNGDLRRAVESNLSGVLLFFIAAAASPVLLGLAIRGRPVPGKWFAQIAISAIVATIAISFIEWLFRLAF